jgi:hypothetical protein
MEELKRLFAPSKFLDEVFKDNRLHCDVLRQALDLGLTVSINGVRYEKGKLAMPVPTSPCEDDFDDGEDNEDD